MNRFVAVVVREIREAVLPTILFLWLFHMIALTKAVTLGDYSVNALRATVATIGALLVAKAILVVEALPLARIFPHHFWKRVLWKTLLFNVVVMVFRLLEEMIPLVAKHDSVALAVRHLWGEIAWPQFWVFHLWLASALFLYCLAAELVRKAGPDAVKAMLRDAPSGQAGR